MLLKIHRNTHKHTKKKNRQKNTINKMFTVLANFLTFFFLGVFFFYLYFHRYIFLLLQPSSTPPTEMKRLTEEFFFFCRIFQRQKFHYCFHPLIYSCAFNLCFIATSYSSLTQEIYSVPSGKESTRKIIF